MTSPPVSGVPPTAPSPPASRTPPAPGVIASVLIANRGEIAARVARTAERLGVAVVAIGVAGDEGALRVGDDVREVPSYLDIDAIVAVARDAGVDAVHPGYGFLSERAAFARALEAAGITLVGPSAAVMEQMGRKDAARDIAVAAGVPVVPAYDVDDDPADFSYPVLVKAAAGGGGKGMRVVRSPGEYAEALAAARREAAAAFGDDTMLIERYVERGRHIEVQVLGDTHGAVVHLGERDCSPQRRHQKVLEEAPAPTLDDTTRTRIRESGVALAAEVGYTGAGTVEFLLDADTGDFFFLEMNTRLQVEHPVTEAVVRVAGEPVDLVELQLRVAAGRPLGFGQDDVTVTGHAIEARVYAEDAYGGFLPQAGRATYVAWPSGEGVRVDEALESGQVVSTAYDPMLGKVVAFGHDREEARRRLVAALDRTAILGLTTNAGFLRELAASPEFREAAIDTAWLDRNALAEPDPGRARELAAWEWFAAQAATSGAWQSDGFRAGGSAAPIVVELDEPVTLGRQRPDARPVARVGSAGVEVVVRGQRHLFAPPEARAGDALASGDQGVLTAPMPGTVLDVRVTVGESVEEGQVLGVLEAMKMELSLRAPYAGTVTEVGATAGQQVPIGATLFHVEPESDDAA